MFAGLYGHPVYIYIYIYVYNPVMFQFAGTVLNNTRLEQVCYILKS